MNPIIDQITSEQLRNDHPEFRAGDRVRVHFKVREGEKERIQVFEGDVIAIKGGGIAETFTVRKTGANNVGVERIFPVHSPRIERIELQQIGRVRRAKLYYLRERSGKAAKIRRKRHRKGN